MSMARPSRKRSISSLRGYSRTRRGCISTSTSRRKDASSAASSMAATSSPSLPSLKLDAYDYALAGSAKRWGDYKVGDKIDHVDGQTIEEAEHQLATRLFQNTARVHFNQHIEAQGRFKRRIVYGGHVISIARALSFNGLTNAFHLAAINGGRHVAPSFAGDTI